MDCGGGGTPRAAFAGRPKGKNCQKNQFLKKERMFWKLPHHESMFHNTIGGKLISLLKQETAEPLKEMLSKAREALQLDTKNRQIAMHGIVM